MWRRHQFRTPQNHLLSKHAYLRTHPHALTKQIRDILCKCRERTVYKCDPRDKKCSFRHCSRKRKYFHLAPLSDYRRLWRPPNCDICRQHCDPQKTLASSEARTIRRDRNQVRVARSTQVAGRPVFHDFHCHRVHVQGLSFLRSTTQSRGVVAHAFVL